MEYHLIKKYHSYINNDVAKYPCNCVDFKPPRLYYWFEVLVHNWPVVIFSEVALILIIIPYYSVSAI